MIRMAARCALVTALAASGAMIWSAQQEQRSPGTSADSYAPIHYTRIYSGADGQSHAEQMEAKLGSPNTLGVEQSEELKAASTNFVRFPSDFFEDWHCAHTRRYVITLTGRGEAEIGGGRKIPMEPGRVVLFEDMTGKGHMSRALTADWTAVFVQLHQK
jgi:hypothetical protein